MHPVASIAILAGIVATFFILQFVARRLTEPLVGSLPYQKHSWTRRDGETVMLYTLHDPSLNWAERLILPLDTQIQTYWRVEIADAEARASHEKREMHQRLLADTGVMCV